MKKCIRWMSLAAVVFAAAGVLWGCGSGAGREASATMAAQPPPAANTYAAKAAETMAAMEYSAPFRDLTLRVILWTTQSTPPSS